MSNRREIIAALGGAGHAMARKKSRMGSGS
jgi:hypothetical protein